MYKDLQTIYMHASSTDEHSRLVYAPLLFDMLPVGNADLVDGKHLSCAFGRTALCSARNQ